MRKVERFIRNYRDKDISDDRRENNKSESSKCDAKCFLLPAGVLKKKFVL
jgi:hypothetical protein